MRRRFLVLARKGRLRTRTATLFDEAGLMHNAAGPRKALVRGGAFH